jgi:hypothetical protein
VVASELITAWDGSKPASSARVDFAERPSPPLLTSIAGYRAALDTQRTVSGREGRRLSERFSLASDAVAQCWLGRMWVLRGCCWKIAVASIHHGFRTPSPRFRHNNNGGSFGSAIRGESRKQQRPGVLLSEKTQGGDIVINCVQTRAAIAMSCAQRFARLEIG